MEGCYFSEVLFCFLVVCECVRRVGSYGEKIGLFFNIKERLRVVLK